MDDEQRLLILGADDVAALGAGHEQEVLDAVREAYLAHRAGHSSLPHSTFLRFPGDDLNRIIALPAFLGDGFSVAGMKWIASFPGNVAAGTPRASAVLVLNSCRTGRPFAVLESSLVSAWRTAASAALAAAELTAGRAPASAGLVGTGLINREVVHFLRTAVPSLGRFACFDLDRARAERFAAGLAADFGVEVTAAASVEEAMGHSLVSFATTAVQPHVASLDACPPGATVLHVSLRDLTAEAILAADNVVDDPDHVCRASTSVHLAEQVTGSRDFIRCTLADVLAGAAAARQDDERVTVFSPFGLGVLDLAVGKRILDRAVAEGRGTTIESFLPAAGEPGKGATP
ncbi:MAG TPA: 2,3-diaminopropionate biosynthesis protein SbnB [Thermoanaerobaculia bacterium]|nr:2,3-diaminopropionate biosynthesis protein SbnB [Thermoanaerobaculia bacterium]